MQRLVRRCLLAWLAGAALGLAAGSLAQPDTRVLDLGYPHRPDELLVGLTPPPSDPDKAAALEQRRRELYDDLDIRVIGVAPRIRVALLQIPPPGGDEALERVAARLATQRDLFEYVDPNRLVFLHQASDPEFAAQWALTKIEAPQAWNVTTGDADVVVAVIDSGVADDAELASQLWVNPCEGAVADGVDGVDSSCGGLSGNGLVDDVHGWSFVGMGSSDIDDAFDHGTQVAGVIGAMHQNGRCIRGVAAKVALMPLRVSGSDGHGDVGRAVLALEYAVDASADLVNASWSTDWDASLLKALQDAESAGILVVAAAGRGPLPPASLDLNASYPCSFGLRNVLCVAATTQADALLASSSWGKNTVHLGAPGEDILSVARADACRTSSGTSMAVPHVVGVAALVRSKCKGATISEVRSRLLAGDAVSALAQITSSGTRLNARRALEGPCTPRIFRWTRVWLAKLVRWPFWRASSQAPAPPQLVE